MSPLLFALALSPGAAADSLTVEGLLQGLPGGGAATGAGLRLDSGGRAFLSAEGRVGSGGALDCHCVPPDQDRWWTGRATAGLDLLGGSDTLDLSLGLFLGTAGSWEPLASSADATAGFELGLGLNLGRLGLRYRHADGMRGPLEGWMTENELRLGYALTDHLALFGQGVRFNPGDAVPRGGYGFGAALRF